MGDLTRRQAAGGGAVVLVLLVLAVSALVWPSSSTASGLGTVSVLEPGVDIRDGATAFARARNGQSVSEGDGVRTDATGFAEINYFDGSLTRLDALTTFLVTRLVSEPGERRIETRLDKGRSWNRVAKLTATDGSFEVETPVAVAAVRGTTFIVDCRFLPRCTITVIEGVVEVRTRTGERRTLRAGQLVTIGGDGTLSPVGSLSPEELASDPFIARNQALDAERAGTGTATTTTLPLGDVEVAGVQVERTTTTATAQPRVVRRSRPAAATTSVTPITPTTTTTTAPPPPPAPGTIAYTAFDGSVENIYTIRADGAGRQKLISNGRGPAWSPDGSMLAFSRPDGSGGSSLWLANADGSGQTSLVGSAGSTADDPAWSPDGTKIAYTGGPSSGSTDLFVIDVGALATSNLTSTASMSEAQPTWSVSDVIAFASSEFLGDSIHVINPDGSGRVQLTPTTGLSGTQHSPDWSPVGAKLAFGRGGVTCSGRISVMDASGANELVLPITNCISSEPSWSPSGAQVAFYSLENTTMREGIWIADADGSDLRILTNDLGYQPDWRPGAGG